MVNREILILFKHTHIHKKGNKEVHHWGLILLPIYIRPVTEVPQKSTLGVRKGNFIK